jgi:CheY-like chemotaxis protein
MSNIDQTNNRLCVIGESDPFLARLLQRFAEKSGLRIQFARTGEDVLELAQRDTPGLIILEPELPGKVRGWEAAQALRASDQTRHTLIIICSWLKKPEALALVGQVFAYLQKPDLRYEDFTAALNAAGVKITPGKFKKPD